jgi:hypothetical protein
VRSPVTCNAFGPIADLVSREVNPGSRVRLIVLGHKDRQRDRIVAKLLREPDLTHAKVVRVARRLFRLHSA